MKLRKRNTMIALSIVLSILFCTGISAEAKENTTKTTNISGEWIYSGDLDDVDFSSGLYYLKYTLTVYDGFKTQSIPVTAYVNDKNITPIIYVYSNAANLKFNISYVENQYGFYNFDYPSTVEMKEDFIEYEVKFAGDMGSMKTMRFQIKKSPKPVMKELNISKGSSDTFYPSSTNYVFINSAFFSAVPMTSKLTITNSKGKMVYEKTLPKAESRVNTFIWNGKAAKNNKANLSSSSFVSPGIYDITIENTQIYGKMQESVRKSNKIKIGKPVTSVKYGNDQKNLVPILTGDAEIDYMAEDICKKIIKKGMSNEQKIRAVYNWIILNCRHEHDYYDHVKYKPYYDLNKLKSKIDALEKKNDARLKNGEINYGVSQNENEELFPGIPNNFAEIMSQKDILLYRVGVCDLNAAAFQVLANHVGFESEIVNGYYLNRNGTKSGHAWNYVKLNGKIYWVDVDIELQNWTKNGKGKIPYYWYLKSYNEFLTNHEWNVEDYPK